MGIELIYCAAKNRAFESVALAAGYTLGAQLPCTTYHPIGFADQDWKPHTLAWAAREWFIRYRLPGLADLFFGLQSVAQRSRAGYMAALSEHRPRMATVLDWERSNQLGEVLDWAEEAAQYCERVLIIPKVMGGIGQLPRRIGGRDVVLAFSIPTKFGGTQLPLWEFADWPIHLLGGSPHAQMKYAAHLDSIADVVSADGNMANKMAHAGRFWDTQKGPKGHWRNLREIGVNLERDNNLEAFRRSCINIKTAWGMR